MRTRPSKLIAHRSGSAAGSCPTTESSTQLKFIADPPGSRRRAATSSRPTRSLPNYAHDMSRYDRTVSRDGQGLVAVPDGDAASTDEGADPDEDHPLERCQDDEGP